MDEKVKRAMDNLWYIKIGRRDKVVPVKKREFELTAEEKAFYLDKFKKGVRSVELYTELRKRKLGEKSNKVN